MGIKENKCQKEIRIRLKERLGRQKTEKTQAKWSLNLERQRMPKIVNHREPRALISCEKLKKILFTFFNIIQEPTFYIKSNISYTLGIL